MFHLQFGVLLSPVSYLFLSADSSCFSPCSESYFLLFLLLALMLFPHCSFSCLEFCFLLFILCSSVLLTLVSPLVQNPAFSCSSSCSESFFLLFLLCSLVLFPPVPPHVLMLCFLLFLLLSLTLRPPVSPLVGSPALSSSSSCPYGRCLLLFLL